MARLEITDDPVGQVVFTVTLSRRNLLALLHKLDMEGSARTITNRYIYMDGKLAHRDAALMVLRCENDDEHYVARERAGEMHPDTETFINEREEGEMPFTI